MFIENLYYIDQQPQSQVDYEFLNGEIPSIKMLYDEMTSLQNRLEQTIARTVLRLATERKRRMLQCCIDENLLFKKLSQLATELEADFVDKVECVKWDDFADNSIKITFYQRKDLVLNIYVNEDEGENSIEEAFLSFNDGDVPRIEYNTLPLMAKFIKSML